MLAVVLAAGRGTRLRPLTNDRSKAMLPVAGRPMIARVLDMLAEGGIERVIVVVHRDDRELVAHLARSSWEHRIQFAYQEQRLGMAHAAECASPLVRQTGVQEFVLASCDNLYPRGHVADLIARRRQSRLDAALTLLWTDREVARTSAVVAQQDGFVTDIVEKPTLLEIPDYGGREEALTAPSLYALSSLVLDYLTRVVFSSRGEREFPDALRLLIKAGGKVGGQLVSNRMTLTQPQDFLILNRHTLRSDTACATIEASTPANATIVQPVRIEAEASIASGCHIGPETYLEGSCRVGANAVVRRSVVLRGGFVQASRVVEEAVITRSGRVP